MTKFLEISSRKNSMESTLLQRNGGQVYFVGIRIFAKIIKRKKGYD